MNLFAAKSLSYLRLALRRIGRNPAMTLVNVAGLAVAMSGTMLITLNIRYEMSFDRQHEKYDRIYKLDWNQPRSVRGRAVELDQMAELHEVLNSVSFQTLVPILVHDRQRFRQPITFAPPEIFDVFTVPLLRGDRLALDEPFSMILSETVAAKLFGAQDPMEQILLWDGTYPFTVRGIMEDPPQNSELGFHVLASMVTTDGPPFGGRYYNATWIVVPGGYQYDEHDFGQRARTAYSRVVGPPGEKLPRLQPLSAYHLRHADLGSLYMLTVLGFFVLLVACVNFANLSTAQALTRATETAVRKVLGAQRRELVWQFWVEAWVVLLLAWLLAGTLSLTLLPACEMFLGKDLVSVVLLDPWLGPLILLIGVLPALMGATYPAFVLSRFRPTHALQISSHRGSGAVVRKIMIVAQFGIAAFLLVCTTVVHSQLRLIDEYETGLDHDLAIVQFQSYAVWQRYPVLRDLLRQDVRIRNVAGVRRPPGSEFDEGGLAAGTYRWDADMEARSVRLLGGGGDLINTFGIELLAGRILSEEDDQAPIGLINEAALRQMSIATPEAALGRTLSWETAFPPWKSDARPGTSNRRVKPAADATIVGVVRDFQWESMHEFIEPTILFVDNEWAFWIAIRLDEADRAGALEHLEKSWLQAIPDVPMLVESLSARVARQYLPERRLAAIVTIFAGISIVLTSVGLFSLSTLLVRQRGKSIAIRKVYGGSTKSLIGLLTNELTWLVVIGNLIAAPISYRASEWWLENFAYRTQISLLFYLATAVATIIIAWLVVCQQTLRVVLANPTEALRDR